MRNKKYILPLSIITGTSWVTFILALTNLEPCSQYDVQTFCASISSGSMIMFFLTLFLALTGTFTLLGYLTRFYIYKEELYFNHLGISIRQGILLSICSVTAIGFLSINVLRWWTALLLLSIIVMIEFYFLSKDNV
jgi:hypothetical protein